MSGHENQHPMRLRPDLPRVTRLSRKVLAGAAAVALTGIGGALIYALQTRDASEGAEELFSTDNRQTADGLAGLPRDYAGPVLGPPLPGDLGRPILQAQNRGQPVVAPAIAPPAVDEAEQRRLAEEEAARTSSVFFQRQQGAMITTADGAPGARLAGVDLAGLATQSAQQGDPGRQSAFLDAATDRHITVPDRIMAPASPFVLQAGGVIAAALVTGIRSDLPGQVTAQVTENVFDSPSGSFLLIPQGARLVGQYDSDVEYGQRRALLVWNRLILPNGRSIVLERQPGADTQGYVGLEDGVNYHWWDLARAAGLATLLSVGAELAVSDEDRLVRALRDGAQDTVEDAAQQIIRRQLTVAPTLTIRPGFPVRVIVTRDLVLEPYQGAS